MPDYFFLRALGRIKSKHLLFLVFLLFSPPGRAQPDPSAVNVRVGIFQNEPLVFLNSENKPQGIYVDLLNEIAAQEGWTLEYVFGTWAEGLNRLQSREIDLMTSIADTEERDRQMDFSHENILTMWGQVYVRDKTKIEHILDLEGLKVAILEGGINGITFQKLIKSFGVRCRIISTGSFEHAARMVEKGSADACVLNNVHGYRLVKRYKIYESAIMFNPFGVKFAVPEGVNGRLLSAIDRHISEWKQEKDSFYYDRLKRWYEAREPPRFMIPKWLVYIITGCVGIILVSLFWIRALRLQVKERKKIQEALTKSEHRFRCLSDASFEGILVTEKGLIVEANHAISTMFSYETTELVGMDVSDLVVPENRGKVREKISSGYDTPYEVKGLKKDGAKFPIVIQAKIFEYRGRQVRVAAIRDLTEQQKAEEEMDILRRILPLCAYCKKVRDDQGYWEQVDIYIHKYSLADITHSVCPECLKQHHPDVWAEDHSTDD